MPGSELLIDYLGMKHPWLRQALLVGLALFGIAIIWPIFNTYVPLLLAEFNLSATVIGFIMTWDNYLNIFFQPAIGSLSDRTQSRLGRRKPWMLAGAPLAAIFFILIPATQTTAGIALAILATNIGMALFRTPTSALLGDLFPPDHRSKANGVLNLMGGAGAILAFVAGGLLFGVGEIAPFAFGGVVMLAAIILVVCFLREPERSNPVDHGDDGGFFHSMFSSFLNRKNKAPLVFFLALISWSMSFRALETWISSFGRFSLGMNPGQISLVTAVFAIMFVVMAVPSGLAADRFRRKRVILIGLICLALLSSIGWFIQQLWELAALLFLTGAAWALINVNALPLFYDLGRGIGVGVLTGLYFLASDVAAVLGPQMVGILIDLTDSNYRMLFAFATFFSLLGALLLFQLNEPDDQSQIQSG